MLGSFAALRNSRASDGRGIVHPKPGGKRCTSYAVLIRIGGLKRRVFEPLL